MTRLETFTLEITKAYVGNPATKFSYKNEELASSMVAVAKLILDEIDKHDTKPCPNCGKIGNKMDDHHYCQNCRESFK